MADPAKSISATRPQTTTGVSDGGDQRRSAQESANAQSAGKVIGFNAEAADPIRAQRNAIHRAAPPVDPAAFATLKARATAAEKILVMEAQLRQLPGQKELRYFAANEFGNLIPCEQILVHEPGKKCAPGKVTTITAIAAPDPNAPFLRWLEDEIAFHCKCRIEDTGGGDVEAKNGSAMQYRLETGRAPRGNFALPCALTIPLEGRRAGSGGAITFLSRRTLAEEHANLAKRLCETYGHAQRQFERRSFAGLSSKAKPIALAAMLITCLIMLIPVPLTVLAPVTIRPLQPEIVAAPLSGVIEYVHVEPNNPVQPGDLLFSFNRTEWQNQFELAQKNIAISEARYKRANQDAFNAREGRRELAIAKAELALALAERDAAQRRLSLVDVHARSAGIVLFDSREKWKGKPVSTGERVMRIADPSKTRFGIDLAVEDSIILTENAQVKVFLDADPLNPIDAVLTGTSYTAERSERDTLVFPLRAEVSGDTGVQLRIGLKGTAQLYGEKVPLWFYLFRKPISFLRQYFGF